MSASVCCPPGGIRRQSRKRIEHRLPLTRSGDGHDLNVSAVDMLKWTDIETGRPCVTCGCSPQLNPEVGRARQLGIPSLIDVLWERLAVSLSSLPYRWPFRYQPFLPVCCEAKLRGASDGFASHRVATSACAKASDARAAQSRRSRSCGGESVISSLLLWLSHRCTMNLDKAE